MNEKYEILTIKLGNFLTLCFVVSFEKQKDNTYILRNEKMNYEYYSEEKDKSEAKKDFAEAILTFLISGIKEQKIFKWLENWGFKQKINDKEAFNSALKDIEKKVNKQKNNFKENTFSVNNESLLFENNLDNLQNNQMDFNWGQNGVKYF